MDIQIGVGSIHLTRKHTLKFESFQFRLQGIEISTRLNMEFLVGLLLRQFQQIFDFDNTGGQVIYAEHHRFQLRPLLTQGLCVRRFFPHFGLTQFQLYLRQPILLGVVVKDTP